MTIEEKIEALRAQYEDKGGIIGVGVGTAGINIYFDPDQKDEAILKAAVKAGEPFHAILKETKVKPEAAEKLAKEQLAPDADLGCMFKEGDDVVYCFYLPEQNRAVNCILQEDKLVEHAQSKAAE